MQFVQARWFHPGGNNPITRVVIHDAEYPERVTAAEELAEYFTRTDRKVSAHFVCDVDSTVQCVRETDIAFHAPPNTGSIGIELIGYAKQTTADWLDDYGTRMLEHQAAPLVRELCQRYSLPMQWLTVDQLLAGMKGIASHNNVSRAFHQSTHTDPGPNFPYAQFMLWVNEVTPGPGPHPGPQPHPPTGDINMPFLITNEDNNFSFLIDGNRRRRLNGPDRPDGDITLAECRNLFPDKGKASTRLIVAISEPDRQDD